MVTETPIADTEGPASQEVAEMSEAPEPEVSEAPREPEVSAEPTPKKRGRPKKEPPPPPEPAPKKPRGRPKKPPPTSEAPEAPEASAPQPFTLDSMSSAMLVAELVNRKRQAERQMKQNLYRSFVM